jgi:hypothetical protein
MTDTSDCVDCPINTRSLGGGSLCTPCNQPYEWTDGPGSSYCRSCGLGSYVVTDSNGAKSCQQCQSGTFNTNPQSLSIEDCIPCGQGRTSGEGAWFCYVEDCPDNIDEDNVYQDIINTTCNMYPSSISSSFLVMDPESLGFCSTCDFSFINSESNVVEYTEEELGFWYNLSYQDRTTLVTYISDVLDVLMADNIDENEEFVEIFIISCEENNLDLPEALGGPAGTEMGIYHLALISPQLFFPLYITCPDTRLGFDEMMAKMETTVWYQAITNTNLSGKTEQCNDCIELLKIYAKMFYNFRSLQIAYCTTNPDQCSENWSDFQCSSALPP